MDRLQPLNSPQANRWTQVPTRSEPRVDENRLQQDSIFVKSSVESVILKHDLTQFIKDFKAGDQADVPPDSSKAVRRSVETKNGVTVTEDIQNHSVTVTQKQAGQTAPQQLSLIKSAHIDHLPDLIDGDLKISVNGPDGESLTETITASGKVSVDHSRVDQSFPEPAADPDTRTTPSWWQPPEIHDNFLISGGKATGTRTDHTSSLGRTHESDSYGSDAFVDPLSRRGFNTPPTPPALFLTGTVRDDGLLVYQHENHYEAVQLPVADTWLTSDNSKGVKQ